MKRILLLLLVLTLGLFVGCDSDDVPDGGTTPVVGYKDPTHKTGSIKVTYRFGNKGVIHLYEKGEMPDPPAFSEYNGMLNREGQAMTFTGWDKELVPVTENVTYTATYTLATATHTVTMQIGNRQQTLEVEHGTVPTLPTPADLADGGKFALWDKELGEITEDVTVTAIFTHVVSPEEMASAYRNTLMHFPTDSTWADNFIEDPDHPEGRRNTMDFACSLVTLLVEEYNYPTSGPVRDRIIAHLESATSEGKAPSFDACCLWAYAPYSASIAMAKQTPSVWNEISSSLKEKLDTTMKAYAYVMSFATSDENDYRTGPGLGGNYRKSWNPNYQMANIPVIVFVTNYFGNGDMVEGAKTVNTMLKDFDEAAYNEMIGRFDVYGWRRAYSTWTKPALTDDSVDAKTVMIQGGAVVHKNVSGDGLESSSGKGVTNGGEDYRYAGFTLAEGAKIIERVIETNYSGGKVVSEHYFNDEKVGYIIDGSKSPFEGQEGMMLEFASGNRSSTVYCSHDFLLATTILVVARDLGIYDYTENEALWQKIIVGNGDFLYKNGKGYQGYSTGSYGVSVHQHGETDEHELGYFNIKSLWLTYMYPS